MQLFSGFVDLRILPIVCDVCCVCLQVKSVQYRIEQCNYNPLIDGISQCKNISEVVGSSTSVLQTTLQSKLSILAVKFEIPTTRDMKISIYPVALNLKEGPPGSLIVRLDKASSKYVYFYHFQLSHAENFTRNICITMLGH